MNCNWTFLIFSSQCVSWAILFRQPRRLFFWVELWQLMLVGGLSNIRHNETLYICGLKDIPFLLQIERPNKTCCYYWFGPKCSNTLYCTSYNLDWRVFVQKQPKLMSKITRYYIICTNTLFYYLYILQKHAQYHYLLDSHNLFRWSGVVRNSHENVRFHLLMRIFPSLLMGKSHILKISWQSKNSSWWSSHITPALLVL